MWFPLSYIPLLSITILSSFTNAQVTFSSPTAGGSVPGGRTLLAQWTAAAGAEPLTSFTGFELALMAGGNSANNMQQLLVFASTGSPPSFGQASGIIPANIGGTGTNAYFLKITLTSPTAGTVITYSSRFTMTGMTGVFTSTTQQGVTANAGAVAGPPTQKQNAANNNAAPAAGGAFATPYNEQVGTMRYAPMEVMPPNKITAKDKTPLFPESAFTIASTYLPIASVMTTVTEPLTWVVQSNTNTNAAASQPTAQDAMQKFLNRWKD